ncbi:hypothetical protein GLAREA_07223 [Glarea lozoyensis ATCC 20868]|uniref:Uncharacterized protein n=1 Tax=Glarea lozoyensis (strain ATCC 20868 / MF5171) TaxID=1116229 RepID=S3D918_GLAL2|nr:uncharacterized protein GLAREA_07223 [Glarea lozoyensis ATCC 20868]EPE34210.1 hypothetical protein GLAREA_07223 [Glarea lozoyensis ATCC 20868]
MAAPLSEIGVMALNAPTSIATSREDDYEVISYSTTQTTTSNGSDSDGPPSSPFVQDVQDVSESANLENISPNKMLRLTSKSPVEREPTSPLKMLKSRASPTSTQSPRKTSHDYMKSPRKMSAPEKRFPVRPSISQSISSPPPEKTSPPPPPVERSLSIDDVLKNNEGLTKAIEILEDNDSEHEEFVEETFVTSAAKNGDETTMDDTMVSTFSNFSAMPDMTMFAKLGQTPKHATMGPTPRRAPFDTPAAAARRRPMSTYSPSPTPRATRTETRDDTNLLDFTEQFNNFSGRRQSPNKTGRESPMKGSDMPWMPSTPSVNRNNMSNLLDFDIPPAPTPRSMPSITPRELETLKSGFLSEISSLKASLSGQEAQVAFLKTAVGDAEKRVGECLEQVREERNLKDQLLVEKEEWDKRGREMEAVLRNVKEEILHGERERDDLEGRLEETERRREMSEVMAQEAERQLAALKAGKPPPAPSSPKAGECACGGQRNVEMAVEKVSRELHTLYKDKHETKVAALKKSYERRWEKKIADLESQIADLTRENEELRLGRDATMTKVDPRAQDELSAQAAKAKELESELEGLNEVLRSIQGDNHDLRGMLDEERAEKGRLVQAVDEMIPLVQAFDDLLAEKEREKEKERVPPPTPTSSGLASPRARPVSQIGMARGSGLRAPGGKPPLTQESRIGRVGMAGGMGSERSRSGSSAGGGRPGSGLGFAAGTGYLAGGAGRSGIMNSIEKMGSFRGRAGE